MSREGRPPSNPQVAGSIPAGRTKNFKTLYLMYVYSVTSSSNNLLTKFEVTSASILLCWILH